MSLLSRTLLSGCALLALFQTFASAAAVPRYFQRHPMTRRDLSVQKVEQELSVILSNGTTMYGPQDTKWEDLIERYNTFALPDIQIVVQPGQESDISKIVKYCNDNSINFLVKNRGHAITDSIGAFQGLQIDMGALLNIDIQPGSKTAWFQGGTYDGQVIDYLWERGYVATTGSCACVGMMGPGLGGGHGRYEGLYGLISDNLVNLNVVLADGSEIRVNETSHSDLFWAMQGAGHNFGIVTSFELKIHPRIVDTWSYHNYIWTGDKLDEVFTQMNILHGNGTTPVNMAINFGIFTMNETISKTDAIIFWTFGYSGPTEDAEKILEPFNKIPAVWDEKANLPYPDIPSIQGTGLDSPLCAGNQTHITSTAGLQAYNLTAEREIYNHFNKKIAQYPQLANARVVHEGYSQEAVIAHDVNSAAYPMRDDFHLMYFDAIVDHGSNMTGLAREWANEVRDMWNEGQPTRKPTTYVNYAAGGEPLESIYGYEPWRLERLRSLKAKYDPENRFRYFMPIISGN
ncbi:FAD-binding domain-containing protein [Hypomontagnella submonticulosa]|nr:FAD-binding domain-containing protein [Hypomontagnella submonticulosa]